MPRESEVDVKVLGNVKLSLCLTKHHSVKTYGGVEEQLLALTSALDAAEWSASRPGRFTPGKEPPSTHRTGGWVDPKAILDMAVKRIHSSRRESTLEHRSSSP
jgi:hypothetical protein